jgi:hypothetical protein
VKRPALLLLEIGAKRDASPTRKHAIDQLMERFFRDCPHGGNFLGCISPAGLHARISSMKIFLAQKIAKVTKI